MRAGARGSRGKRVPHARANENGGAEAPPSVSRELAPRAGFEPATCRLTVGCSTTELPGIVRERAAYSDAIVALPSPNGRKARRRRVGPCRVHRGARRRADGRRPLAVCPVATELPRMDPAPPAPPPVPAPPRALSFAGRQLRLPTRKPARIALGAGLVLGGVLGFLPILGFWMIPLGLIILGHDVPSIRRRHRRLAVRWGRWRRRRAMQRSGGA